MTCSAESDLGNPWFDTTSFAPVTAARFGTSKANGYGGPGYANLDASLFRTFRLSQVCQGPVPPRGSQCDEHATLGELLGQTSTPSISGRLPLPRILAANTTNETFGSGFESLSSANLPCLVIGLMNDDDHYHETLCRWNRAAVGDSDGVGAKLSFASNDERRDHRHGVSAGREERLLHDHAIRLVGGDREPQIQGARLLRDMVVEDHRHL